MICAFELAYATNPFGHPRTNSDGDDYDMERVWLDTEHPALGRGYMTSDGFMFAHELGGFYVSVLNGPLMRPRMNFAQFANGDLFRTNDPEHPLLNSPNIENRWDGYGIYTGDIRA